MTLPGHRHFVCPTDHLEAVIESHFDGDHYFVSSLGNTIDFNLKFANYLSKLIETKGITEISFVLAEDNLVLHNIEKIETFRGLRGLHTFYGSILKSEIHAKEILALKKRLNKIYAKHTKREEEEINKALERDNFMTPAEAKEFGLIDEVVEKRS